LQVELAVQLYDGTNPGPVFTTTVLTDPAGRFTLTGIPSGTYRVRVKQPQALAAESHPLVSGDGVGPLNAQQAVSVTFSPLAMGDADNSNTVDITDFSLLRATFGNATRCATNRPFALPCTDFDANGAVDIVDFSLLRTSFGQVGAPLAR